MPSRVRHRKSIIQNTESGESRLLISTRLQSRALWFQALLGTRKCYCNTMTSQIITCTVPRCDVVHTTHCIKTKEEGNWLRSTHAIQSAETTADKTWVFRKSYTNSHLPSTVVGAKKIRAPQCGVPSVTARWGLSCGWRWRPTDSPREPEESNELRLALD